MMNGSRLIVYDPKFDFKKDFTYALTDDVIEGLAILKELGYEIIGDPILFLVKLGEDK